MITQALSTKGTATSRTFVTGRLVGRKVYTLGLITRETFLSLEWMMYVILIDKFSSLKDLSKPMRKILGHVIKYFYFEHMIQSFYF